MERPFASMITSGFVRTTGAVALGGALLLGSGSLVLGCGGSGGGSTTSGPLECGAHPGSGSPDTMPSGQNFSGVWHSPQYGEMHFVQTGQQIVGEYTRDERSGRVQGTAQGNVMRFEWSERRELVAGRPTTTRGRGYFRFFIGADGDAYLVGEWGPDDREDGGGPWCAARDRRRRPHLSTDSGSGSSGSTGTTGGGDDMGGDSFDDPDSSGSSSGSRSRDSGLGDDLDGL